MKILQKIPKDISLQQELYEWTIIAQNRKWNRLGEIIVQALVLSLMVGIEIVALYKLKEIWAAPYKYDIWFYAFFYPAQALIFILVLKEILWGLRRSWEIENKRLELSLKNDGFTIILKDIYTNKEEQQVYKGEQLQEVFYNQGPQKTAAALKKSFINPPQELFIRLHKKVPEGWGRFLRPEQTKFLALLLRELYAKKKVDQQIPLEPPAPLEVDDFEDLSQHLIDE